MKIKGICLLLTILLYALQLASCHRTNNSQESNTATDTPDSNTIATDTITDTVTVTDTDTNTNTDTESETEAETRPDPILVDAFVGFGDIGFELVYHKDSIMDRYAAALCTVAEKLDGLATVYEMTAPAACYFGLTAEENIALGASDPVAAMTYTHNAIQARNQYLLSEGRMKNALVSLNICDLLGEKYAAGEYVYFRTDHHWTGLGAYHVSRYFLDLMGKSYLPLSAYREVALPNFLGSLHRHTQSEAMAANPDTVYAYISPTVNTMTIYRSGEYKQLEMIRESVSSSNKYTCFCYGDNPYSEIHNETIKDGSSILIIKDSYGNSFMPMLADSYEYVYGLDYRSWEGDLAAFVKERGIDTVLIINYQVCASLSSYVSAWERFVAQ